MASPVGDGGAAAAIMVPFFDMANHDDASLVSAIKSVGVPRTETWRTGCASRWRGRSTRASGDRAWCWRPREGCENADDEVVIQYDPAADNRELMLRYGFSLRGNRNEKLPRPDDGSPASTCALTPGALKLALEAKVLMRESTPPEERRRLISVVANACLGLGGPTEDDSWELDEDACAKEAMDAVALRMHWQQVLDAFETSAVEDESLLTAAKAGVCGATANVVCAVGTGWSGRRRWPPGSRRWTRTRSGSAKTTGRMGRMGMGRMGMGGWG